MVEHACMQIETVQDTQGPRKLRSQTDGASFVHACASPQPHERTAAAGAHAHRHTCRVDYIRVTHAAPHVPRTPEAHTAGDLIRSSNRHRETRSGVLRESDVL